MPSIDFVVRMRSALRVLTATLAATVLLGAAGAASVATADSPGSATGAATTDVVVKKGDRGRAVKAVQRRLRSLPTACSARATHRAVKRFQKRRGLEADGVVRPRTRRSLRLRPFRASSVIRPPCRSRSGSGGLSNLPRALVRIAKCESGGDPQAVSANGKYHGKYQFLRSTWKRWGGRTSDPIDASEAHRIAWR